MTRVNQTIYNFKEVAQPQRSPKWYKRLSARTIRLRPSGISLSKDIAARFDSWTSPENPTTRIFLKIEVDVNNKAIRLSNDEKGYSFQLWPNGNASLSTLPRDIKASGLPLGEYRTCNQNNVFKLAK